MAESQDELNLAYEESKLKMKKSNEVDVLYSGSTSNTNTSTSMSSDENSNRGQWGNKFEFILACIGYSVGLGNVWRFGYLCSKSGGGAFLIPYFITLILVAIPLMYLEFSVGQFTRRGPIGAMSRLCPLLKGTGIATVVISFLLTTYYIVIIAWVLYFLFSSFASQVPWKSCGNIWNTEKCWDGSLNESFKLFNDTSSPSEEFYRRKILNESDSFYDFGTPKLDLVLLVLVGWIVVYFCIWKGGKSTGKVVYLTALFPYAVLVIMLIRGVTLPGASEGIKFFLVPKWADLAKPSVWAYAAIQNFNSIGVAFGGLISMSSYNKPSKKILSDVLTIAVVDGFTSIVCGLTVFSVLGYVSVSQGKSVENVVTGGPGLIFMVLPEAIRNMSFAPLWALLFFFMIFLLGIDSQFTMVETVITTIEDEFRPQVKKFFKRKELLVLFVCVITFFLSFPNLCPGGIFYFTILDFFSAGISVFYIAFFEVIAIVWIYGANRLAKNVYLMNNEKPKRIIVLTWYIITPIFILIIWGFNWIKYEPIKYGDKPFPLGYQLFGWSIALVSICSIPLAAIHTMYKSSGKTLYEKFMMSLRPTILDLDQNPEEYLIGAVDSRKAGLRDSVKIEPEKMMVNF